MAEAEGARQRRASVGGDRGKVTQRRASVGGDRGKVTQRRASVGGDRGKVTQRSASVGGDPLSALGLDPGEAPLEVGQHKLQGLGPLLLTVELRPEDRQIEY